MSDKPATIDPMQYNPPPHTQLNIIYNDEHLLVVEKPAGLLSVPGRGEDKQDCLATRVQSEYPDTFIVHRLDMATSGLMLMARNEQMQRLLSMLFEKRQIDKCYIAIVAGKLENERGEIDLPLITDWPNRPKQKVDYETGKRALTRYMLLDYNPDQNTSRIELKPETGRTHQLRVHMQAIGHPIIGDTLYATQTVLNKSPRLALHAESLVFSHPATQQILKLHSPTPF